MILLNPKQSLEIITTSAARIDYNITITNFDAQGNSTNIQPLQGSITSVGSTLITNNNSTIQQISLIALRNVDASLTNNLSISRVVDGDSYNLPQLELQANEIAVFGGSNWTVSDNKGFIKFVGEQGPQGEGVPTGGTTGQVLAKIDATDFNTEWITPATSSGTVTTVSVVTANGLSGTVANPTTTPAITLNIATLDATKIADGSVSSTEFQYINSLTSNAQTQLNAKEPTITAGTTLQYYRGDKTFQTLETSVVPEVTNLYFTASRVLATVLTGLSITGGSINASDALLAALGKLQNQINGLLGGAMYQGTWDASTNTPTLASGVGTQGYYYVVSVAGSTNLDGITDWKVGDWAIFNGTTWDKVDNTDAVISVNGNIGAVALTGTANRITVSGANVFDISASYVGQGSITTLGTITSGEWNGTPIDNAHLANSTISGISLGSNLNDLTTSTGLQLNSGTTFNGGTAKTISIDSSVVTLTGAQALSNKTGNISQWTNDSGYLTAVVGYVPDSRTITINGVTQDLSANRTFTVTSGSEITATTTFDFGSESDSVVSTISNASLTAANFKSFTAIPRGTIATSLDDFGLNGVSFNIENIVDNTTFDIRATSLNNASGVYTMDYKITYQ